MSTDEAMPLEGIRILDLSTILAAPLATTLLADFGADVVKVEAPAGGDSVRNYPPVVDGQSLPWRVLSRNKRSVTVDLHDAEGRELVRRLGATCDVVVTNFRLGTLRKWELDYDAWQRVRPDIVFFHLTAFGRTGPWQEKPGFARIAEAFAGLTHITGYEDRPPLFAGYPLGDAMGGIYGAFSIMLALLHRERTGAGQMIDLALYEPVLRILEDLFVSVDVTGKSKGRFGNEQDHSCPNGLFPSRDGKWIVLPASSSNMWARLKGVLKDPELEPFDTTPKRVANRAFVEGRVAAFTERYDASELIHMLEEAEVACGLVNTAQDVVENEQVAARENLIRIFDADLGREVLIQAPIPRLSASPGRVRRPAPRLGQHVDEVFREWLGLEEAEIGRLRERKVV